MIKGELLCTYGTFMRSHVHVHVGKHNVSSTVPKYRQIGNMYMHGKIHKHSGYKEMSQYTTQSYDSAVNMLILVV